MKLKSFRIKNYKSIKDSRECYLSNAITVLAGKNESGKTSILEALEDFSTGKKIRKEAIPIHNSELKPEIIVTFEVDEDEFKKISPYLVVDKKKTDITLSKEYYNAYTLINSEELFSKTIKANEKRTNDFEKQANSLISFFKDHQINITLDVLNEKNFSQVSSQFSNLKQNIEAYSSKLAADEKEKVLEIIATLKQIIDEFSNLRNFDSKFLDEFKRHIPKITKLINNLL
ncbi:MAG: ATP-binding protein [Nanoarchaeota archaeon]|nr:ATP-binding protein [Nanoarchaeota archaeon]